INEQDHYTALKEKSIAGAGLDVQVNEPPKQPSPFAELDNVVLTPHSAYYSVEALRALRVKGAEEIARALKGGEAKNWVNRKGFVVNPARK
ncbi:MAG: C-terminal binding protein, partial [Planctomycetes bacterium]|nr:C-terminal binding protein [Planctomycetota bacterium]